MKDNYKGEITLSLFHLWSYRSEGTQSCHTISLSEWKNWNSKDCLRKFLVLGLISTFKNVTKDDINTEKSIVFLYTNNELTKKETRDFGNLITIPLKTMHSNKPNQGSGRLFLRNFRTLKEDAKEDTRNTRRQKHPHIYIGRINTVKMAHHWNQCSDSVQFLSKIMVKFSKEIEKYNFKIHL